MASRNYVIGRRFEYRVQAFFRKLGYYVIRSYGSKGLFDLIAVPPRDEATQNKYPIRPFLIQCKNHGVLPKKELDNLIKNDKWQGLIVIAFSQKKTRKLMFRNLSGVEYEL